MAFVSKSGVRYESSFDTIIESIKRINIDDKEGMLAGVASARTALVKRPREELHNAEGARFARLRLEGSIRDLRVLRQGALAERAPAQLIALLDEVLEAAVAAYGVAPTFEDGQESRVVPPAPVAAWVPTQLGGPVRPVTHGELASGLVIDLEID